jgi:hypothetical protein
MELLGYFQPSLWDGRREGGGVGGKSVGGIAQTRVGFGPWEAHEEQKPTYPIVLQGPARLVVAFRAAWWYVGSARSL